MVLEERKPQARAVVGSFCGRRTWVKSRSQHEQAEHFTCAGAMAVPRVPHVYCRWLFEKDFIETTGLEKSLEGRRAHMSTSSAESTTTFER